MSSTVDGSAGGDPTTVPAVPEEDSPEQLLAGLPEIELLSPANGGGIRPLLQWEPTGAALYGVYVYAPDGSLYWAWRGREAEVYVGGAVRIDPERPGPSITEGMTWSVVAYDADLLPLASSAIIPIAP
ncbi:MAG TPA: hypothetical protein ENI86_16055 [Acidimicrobiales bacterium]|nr:hypothetical protein [Acidimicrobiales bacterium]